MSGLDVSGLDVSVDSALGARPVCAPSQGEGAASEPRAAKDMHAGKAKRQAAAAGTQEKAETSASHLDFEALAANLGRLADEATRAAHAYIAPRLGGDGSPLTSAEVAEISRTLGEVAERWLGEPQRAVEAQARLTSGLIGLWADALRRFKGEEVPPAEPPDASDRRFRDPAWTQNPFFDFLRQSYVHTAKWAEDMVLEAKDIDPHTRHKAQFYVRQLAAALSPSNFVALNPELIRETLEQNGANLVRGAQMLAEDVEAGGGELKLRQTDPGTFEVGVNLATTPGKVVLRNDLIELIQYAPTTDEVLRRPLLIVPPWINKFYILDLNPEKSFIRWAVAQGLTVFVISWVNPDARHAAKGFDAYMKEGIFAALEAIEKATDENKVTAIGYCVGGTLLSSTLGYMAVKDDRRIESATLLATQVDFTHAGDLQVFVDENQVRAVEEEMRLRGFLDGKRMATAFNMLRPNDLIWRYMVDVYLKGRAPMPFDLLFWNSNSTRMPAANHSFYLRNCYLENNLSQGRMVIDRGEDRSQPDHRSDLQSRGEGRSYRACALDLRGLAAFRRRCPLCAGRLRTYRRRDQSAHPSKIPILDRRAGREFLSEVGRGRRGTQGFMVARLVRLGRAASAGSRARQDTRRPAQTAWRCTRNLCEDQGLSLRF